LPHLTRAQIFDALSYFSDHTDAINQLIQQNRINGSTKSLLMR
jgi:hypothetical protein